MILEHGKNFSFIKHFVEIFGGSRDNSSFSKNTISVHKLYFEPPQPLRIACQRSNYFCMNLVRD